MTSRTIVETLRVLNFTMVFGVPESYVSRKDLVTNAAGFTASGTRLTGLSITFL